MTALKKITCLEFPSPGLVGDGGKVRASLRAGAQAARDTVNPKAQSGGSAGLRELPDPSPQGLGCYPQTGGPSRNSLSWSLGSLSHKGTICKQGLEFRRSALTAISALSDFSLAREVPRPAQMRDREALCGGSREFFIVFFCEGMSSDCSILLNWAQAGVFKGKAQLGNRTDGLGLRESDQ